MRLPNWVSWIGLIGSAVTISAFVAAALTSPPAFVYVGLSTLLCIFLIVVAIQAALLADAFVKHFEAVSSLVLGAQRLMAGSVIGHKRWQKAFDQRETTVQHVRIELLYQDKEGHRVKLQKHQNLRSHVDNKHEIWDRNLRASGPFDWDSLETRPGTPDMKRLREVGVTWEIPTVFSNPLPLDQTFMRMMSVDVLDSFKSEEEDFIFTVSKQTEAATIVVTGINQMEFGEARGEVWYGNFHLSAEQRPYLVTANQIVWNLTAPQVGERYRLVWKHLKR